MFEEELELEKKEGGGFGPVIVIVLMVALIVGGIGYVVWQGTQTLKPDEATKVLTAALQQQNPLPFASKPGISRIPTLSTVLPILNTRCSINSES